MCRRTLVFLAAAFAVASLQPASASAAIQPGAQTFTNGAQCTANFVFRNAGGTYLGQAAHCSSTGGATETDGCTSGSLRINTPVEISGASRPGTLVYNSWIAMQAANEANPDACAYNDFALVKLHPDDVANVDPSVPGFGGPTRLGGPTATGATVFSWGNSSLRAGITKLSPKQGVVVSTEGDGWSHSVYTATPGIPGDSGSGFLNADGEAIGVLSTVAILPLPLSNGVGDLGKELAYAKERGFTVDLLPGTKPFRADLVGAILGS